MSDLCKVFKKNAPRSVVGFSLGIRFNRTVVMDIKKIKGHKVLDLVDHATRYSVGIKLQSKESSNVLTAFFKHWVTYFGATGTFLTDNS